MNYKRLFAMIPAGLRDRIDRSRADIRDFVWQCAQATAPGQLLVDAGAGESQYRHFFAHTQYLAVDLAHGDTAWDYSRLDVIGSLDRLPIAEGVADVVLCTQVLEHVRAPQRVVDEIYRVLKPGGVLYLTAPQGWGEHQQPHDYFRFTSFALKMLYENAGFGEIEIKPLGGFFVYLGNRTAQAPKYLFSRVRPGVAGLAWRPLQFLCLALCSVLLPMLCNALDRFDAKQDYTLGYACVCHKPR